MKTLGIICLLIAVLKLQTVESFSKQGVWVYGKCTSRHSCVERRDCAELAKDENDACPDSAPDSAICCQK
ncbi:maker143, partial [Drosophila busckii]